MSVDQKLNDVVRWMWGQKRPTNKMPVPTTTSTTTANAAKLAEENSARLMSMAVDATQMMPQSPSAIKRIHPVGETNQTNTNNKYSTNCSQLPHLQSMFKSTICFRIIFLLSVINSSLVAVSAATAADLDVDGFGGDGDADADSVYGHYTPTWAVHIPEGRSTAERVAADHGFTILAEIIDDHYHFHHNSISKRSTDAADHHQRRLSGDDRVRWSKQQRVKSRSKRDFIRMRTSRITPFPSGMDFNDEKWEQMWYLKRGRNLDMNVLPAWKEGVTGNGVVVTILDDGLEFEHPDLEKNYDPKASYDVNGNDENPSPLYDLTDSNRHGTRCAGEVAATANNSICAVGIAYNANVGGVRMLDGEVTDAVEARSLSFNPQHIDIYSASWGPDDDGKTVDGPGELATKAFIEGVTKGRNGRGSIFVWASGNGGREHDNCNCDGYTNSIWTLSISSATERGNVPWYSEKCSSTLATTYSSGGQNEKQVITTDLHNACTGSHTGTSASAPLAAGIVALVLDANKNLTWRDLQHIVVRTAKPTNLNDTTWAKNGVGRRVSHSFGYGLMDAYAMVKAARTWKTVPEQQRCEINAPHLDKVIERQSHLTLQLKVEHCRNVNYLEHVQAKITLTSQRRGDIKIYLTSPAGTRVNLLTSRSHDVSRSGFNQWPFMSVHTWGESPHGNWQLEIHNDGSYMAQITHWELICYGTETPAQPDDQPYFGEGESGVENYNNALEHNSLDFETEPDNGQWRVMHQVGENPGDVQRNTLNDQTGTACLKFSPNQTCIECLQQTYLYEGRCYTACPERTYMQHKPGRDIEVTTSRPTEQKKHSSASPFDDHHHSPVSLRANSNDPQPRRRAVLAARQPSPLCKPCHFSCLTCYGPNDYDCATCAPDAILTQLSATETFCSPQQLNNKPAYFMPFSGGSWLITYGIIAAVFQFVCIIGFVVWRRAKANGKTSEYSYDSVAVDDDAPKEAESMTTDSHVVDSCSDSDGEHDEA